MLMTGLFIIFCLFASSVVFVTRSRKNPWRNPARELPCGKIRILSGNHYLIILVCVLMIHGSFIILFIKKAQHQSSDAVLRLITEALIYKLL